MDFHPDGYIIGGAHEQGLNARTDAVTRVWNWWLKAVIDRQILVDRNKGKLRYKINKLPSVFSLQSKARKIGCKVPAPAMVGLARSEYWLHKNEGRWFSENRFKNTLLKNCQNLVDYYKTGL